MRKMNNYGEIGVILGIVIIVIAVIIVGFIWFQQANSRYYITGKVLDKWVDNSGEGSYYLVKIQLEDGSTKMLECNRNILHGSNYNPDFVYSDIQKNVTYKFTCWGWDFQWYDVYWYPLIIITEEVN